RYGEGSDEGLEELGLAGTCRATDEAVGSVKAQVQPEGSIDADSDDRRGRTMPCRPAGLDDRGIKAVQAQQVHEARSGRDRAAGDGRLGVAAGGEVASQGATPRRRHGV